VTDASPDAIQRIVRGCERTGRLVCSWSPRVAVSIEGTRSYGIRLARALAAADLLVLECEQSRRRQRRGKGKSGPVDAHLAVLAALRLNAGKLPVPRADGDREALRILLVARQEITVTRTAQIGRLRPCCWPGTTPAAEPPARH